MSEGQKRILVAEADPAARMLLRRRLEAESYEVEIAEDGEIALEVLTDGLPDLLIIDVSLPKIDGITVVRQVRENPRSADLPIIVISAHAKDLVERGLSGLRWPEGFFSKPIDFRELQAKVKTILAPAVQAPVAAGPGAADRGRIVAFVGAKGGVGTSTVAANVAIALTRNGMRTVLVESASFHGTLTTLLGLGDGRFTERLPLDNPDGLTAAAVESALVPHSSGLRVLLGATFGSTPASAEGVLGLEKSLRALAAVSVVDLDSAVDPFGQVALRTADRIWVVTEPERSSVERAHALHVLLERWGVPQQNVGLLVNQTHPDMVLEPAEIGQAVGRPVGCWVPCAAASAFESSRRGMPLIDVARDLPVSTALAALAASFAGRPVPVAR
jgi:DNA-binding response OmpR family regulator